MEERNHVAKIKYQEFEFRPETLALIKQCNVIVVEYAAQGFVLTLRQLYYQLVSRDIIPNRQSEYKRVGSIVNDARLAGLIDWSAIEDRTRNLRSISHWSDPAELISACADQFRHDKWRDQPYRPEVWIEKDALVGVIEGVCQELDVPFFSCRGYTSQSEMWGAAMRMVKHSRNKQKPYVIHLGDHDPSGQDMSRDIEARLSMFLAHHLGPLGTVGFKRIALNMDQVKEYDPPPNPAKLTDSRATGYIAEHGDESWELDALEPTVLAGLIRDSIVALRNDRLWSDAAKDEERDRQLLATASERWTEVETMLEE